MFIGTKLWNGATDGLKKMGRKKFRESVQKELAEHLESFEWDAAYSEFTGDALHLHNIVLKRDVADKIFASAGMRVAEPGIGKVTIGTLRVLVTFKADSTLGIFTHCGKAVCRIRSSVVLPLSPSP